MAYLWPILLVLLNTCWLVLILPGLPGTWLMVVTAFAVDWLSPGPVPMFSLATFALAAVLAGIGEVAEFFMGVGGAAKAGGTRRGAVGALVGGLIGAVALTIPAPLLGTLLGACVGAAVGTVLMEASGGMKTDASIRAGIGAGVGRFLGTLVKFAIGLVIWFVLAVAAFV